MQAYISNLNVIIEIPVNVVYYQQDYPYSNYCHQEVTLPSEAVKPVFTFTYFAECGTHTNNTCVVCLLD